MQKRSKKCISNQHNSKIKGNYRYHVQDLKVCLGTHVEADSARTMTSSARQHRMVVHPRPKRERGRRNPDGAETSQPDMSQVVDPTPDQYHVTKELFSSNRGQYCFSFYVFFYAPFFFMKMSLRFLNYTIQKS